MKGITPLVASLITVILVVAGVAVTLVAYTAITLVPVPLVIDGEYGTDASVDSNDLKGPFYSDLLETTDCNVTGEVMGDTGYIGCVFETNTGVAGAQNNTDYMLDIAFEIDNGPVRSMSVECDLKNTGTLQAKDDFAIEEMGIFSNENTPIPFSAFTIEDGGTEVDAQTRLLPKGEYVFHTKLHAKTISPDGADGDDIMTCQAELDTDEDDAADDWYFTAEVGS